jgi:hypothetical protein
LKKAELQFAVHCQIFFIGIEIHLDVKGLIEQKVWALLVLKNANDEVKSQSTNSGLSWNTGSIRFYL